MEYWIAILKVVAALFLVILNGIFVAAEFAFVKVRPTRIAQLIAEKNKKARAAQVCIENIDEYLSVTQLGITLASLGLGWLGEPAVASLIKPFLNNQGITSPALVHSISFILGFSLITFLHVVFGELAPKSIAIQKAETIALNLAYPMRFFYIIFYPAVALLNGMANRFILLLGIKPAYEKEKAHTEEELRIIISESFKGGHIKESEQKLLQNIFRFEKLIAEEIMIPRPEVVFLNTAYSLEENIKIAQKSGHTRFPLADGSPDKIIGLVHIKDLLINKEKINKITDIKREIMFVPEGMYLDSLLLAFQKNHQHMAVVIDEYGVTLGIVTMELVLEEIVGAIQDEFDFEEPEVIFEENGSLLVSGRILLDEVAERFNIKLGEEDLYSTLAGYILGKLGKKPEEGDCIQEQGFSFEVARMKGMRIDRIRIKNLNAASK